MRFFDLFCGIGGFRLGLERAGHECVGSCEIERHARTIYGKNFGAEPEYADAFKLDARALPDFDILAAGFPCQAFSLAGKRLGFADTRGTLFFEIARIAGQKRPRYLFLENVKGLLSHDEGRTFGTILSTLDELGYDAEWQVINGRYFLPQNRERVFIIGHLRGEPFKQVFPLGSYGETPDGRDGGGAEATHTIDANYGKGPDDHGARTVIASGLWQSRGFEVRKDGVMHCMKGQGGSAGNFIQIAASRTREGSKHLEGNKDGLAFSLTSAQHDNLLRDAQTIRRLTSTECERLMGFPDGWTEGVSDTSRYRCLGNAVMPPVIEYIARHF
jgi:DNA (cytosine-5)-methyltransferase 1